MPVDGAAALNITFVKNPVLSDSSIDLEIDGSFTASDHNIAVLKSPSKMSLSSPSCSGAAEMIQISLHENVLKSASSVYFNVSYCLVKDHFFSESLSQLVEGHSYMSIRGD